MVASTGKYGLTIFSSGRGAERFERAASLARDAEAAGFGAVWTGELYNRSATIPMAVLAQATERVMVGSNIAYGAGRSPMIWAAEARDLDDLSEGRIVLGLGNGTRGMLENWLGVSGDAPAARMAELVDVLRKLWRLHEGPVHHEGRFYRLHLAPTAETPRPWRERLPIWAAGVNAVMVRTAGTWGGKSEKSRRPACGTGGTSAMASGATSVNRARLPWSNRIRSATARSTCCVPWASTRKYDC